MVQVMLATLDTSRTWAWKPTVMAQMLLRSSPSLRLDIHGRYRSRERTGFEPLGGPRDLAFESSTFLLEREQQGAHAVC